ncbi:glycosyl hydrolase [Micromonospora yasonensis]|uniref:glycoside hydrolase family 26 protein n=1 Tax=Micromonospora yasonensis TaxID=1128667 RepID=UPI00222F8E45|nr:glycosyl hydrolase [Micromonospora yasonensis]MCW3842288.1 glycosyl hydrolase [Micromonospora yasonensis]
MRLTLPRVVMALIGVLLLTYAFAVAPATVAGRRPEAPPDRIAQATQDVLTPAVASESPRPAPTVFPPTGKAFIGVMTDKGPYDFTPVDGFTAAARYQPQVMLFSVGWASAPFDRSLFDQISDRGMLPMLGWEPWDQRIDEEGRKQKLANREIDKIRRNQPRYRLSHIARGDFDLHLRSWAEGIKSLGYPVAIRFGHEMNGDWYPWCESVNGNRPGDYVKAWRHVHDLFRDAGVTNVIWVWSANVRWNDSTPALAPLYPGDSYVDWIGMTGYYGSGAFSQYRSFDTIFKRTVTEIRAFSKKPLVVTETGAAEASGRKAEWIREAFRTLPAYPDIIGLIWFEVDKERDWRIVSSPAASAAFAEGVAAPRYDVTWSSDAVPRTEVGR